MNLVEEQIINLEDSIAKLVNYSYENNLYNTELGRMLDITTWHLGQNVQTLKQSNDMFGGQNVQ